MLDENNDESYLRLAETVGQLRCNIDLPEDWDDFFRESGMMPPGGRHDQRRHVRMHMRVRAGLEYRQTAPVLPRTPEWHQVYLRDISRGGLAFVHSEQLFPLERMRMVLPDERIAAVLPGRVECIVEVSRCTRIQGRCYIVGAHFVNELTSTA